MGKMLPSQEAHLARIQERFSQLVDAKYRAGQEENGGYLWRKKMLTSVLEEVVDQVCYVLTLEEQLEEVKNLCVAKDIKPAEALEKIRRIL
jgi:hypothetical protein